MMQQDYYETLGVSPDATPQEIKRSYRKLALETHPDRNPDDKDAGDRFKKISEAYGVLIDPQKRMQYDQYKRLGVRPQAGRSDRYPGGFGYSQDEIFKDFFNSGYAKDIFSEMQQEFQRMGFRFDDRFVNRVFFGGKNIFFEGFFWGGPPGTTRVYHYSSRPGNGGHVHGGMQGFRTQNEHHEKKKPSSKGLLGQSVELLGKAVKSVGGFIVGKALGWLEGTSRKPKDTDVSSGLADITYQLNISREDALNGAKVQIDLPHLRGDGSLFVNIPPGIKTGTRLRLKEKGQLLSRNSQLRGDVYLELKVS